MEKQRGLNRLLTMIIEPILNEYERIKRDWDMNGIGIIINII